MRATSAEYADLQYRRQLLAERTLSHIETVLRGPSIVNLTSVPWTLKQIDEWRVKRDQLIRQFEAEHPNGMDTSD